MLRQYYLCNTDVEMRRKDIGLNFSLQNLKGCSLDTTRLASLSMCASYLCNQTVFALRYLPILEDHSQYCNRDESFEA